MAEIRIVVPFLVWQLRRMHEGLPGYRSPFSSDASPKDFPRELRSVVDSRRRPLGSFAPAQAAPPAIPALCLRVGDLQIAALLRQKTEQQPQEISVVRPPKTRI
jgi:hypothetical protein